MRDEGVVECENNNRLSVLQSRQGCLTYARTGNGDEKIISRQVHRCLEFIPYIMYMYACSSLGAAKGESSSIQGKSVPTYYLQTYSTLTLNLEYFYSQQDSLTFVYLYLVHPHIIQNIRNQFPTTPNKTLLHCLPEPDQGIRKPKLHNISSAKVLKTVANCNSKLQSGQDQDQEYLQAFLFVLVQLIS